MVDGQRANQRASKLSARNLIVLHDVAKLSLSTKDTE